MSENNKNLNQHDAAGAANDWATTRVPMDKRRSTLNMSVVMVTFAISMSGLFGGAALTAGLTATQAIWAIFIGNCILVLYAGMAGAIGAREGLGTYMLLRHSFGRSGSTLVSVIFAITLVGWYAWQCGFFGLTINAMFPDAGFITHPVVAGIWGGVLMMLTAYFGMKGLSAVSWVAGPLILGAAIIGIFVSISRVGGWQAVTALPSEGPIDFATGVTMVVGGFAVGAVIQSDLSRYAKGPGVSVGATAMGFMFAHGAVLFGGFIMALAVGTGDMAVAMLAILGAWSLLVLIVAQWTTNDNNLYSSSLGLSNVVKFPKKNIVLVLGTVATIIGAMGIGEHFASWLILLGVSIPPVAGIMVADYYVINKASYKTPDGFRYGGVSIPAYVSWIIASVLGFIITAGIQSINSLIIGFVVYLVLETLFRKNGWNRHLGKNHILQPDGNTVVEA